MRRPTTEVSAPLSTRKRYGPRPFTSTSTVMRVLTLRALMSSPPMASVSSITAGGSAGISAVGAGRGFCIFGACMAPRIDGHCRKCQPQCQDQVTAMRRQALPLPKKRLVPVIPANVCLPRKVDIWSDYSTCVCAEFA